LREPNKFKTFKILINQPLGNSMKTSLKTNKILVSAILSLAAANAHALCGNYPCVPSQNQYATSWQSHQYQDLTNFNVSSMVGAGSDFYKASLVFGKNTSGQALVMPFSNFFNANLCNATLFRSPVAGRLTNVRRSNYQHAYLFNADMGNADHSGSTFYDINATSSKWDGAFLGGGLWQHMNITGVSFTLVRDGSMILSGVELMRHPEIVDVWRVVKANGIELKQYLIKDPVKMGWVWGPLTTGSTTGSTTGATHTSSN
jgi:uncharacterized protein YjbI with pentapeptide repeats